MNEIRIKPVQKADKQWIVSLLTDWWGSVDIVTRGKKLDASSLPGFIAVVGDRPQGLITYNIGNGECEIVSLNSFVEGKGIGSRLIDTVKGAAKDRSCRRVWLIETNDNTKALHFYQKRGFHLAAVYPNALEESRKLKPEIPLVGNDGIPLRDELELEILL